MHGDRFQIWGITRQIRARSLATAGSISRFPGSDWCIGPRQLRELWGKDCMAVSHATRIDESIPGAGFTVCRDRQ